MSVRLLLAALMAAVALLLSAAFAPAGFVAAGPAVAHAQEEPPAPVDTDGDGVTDDADNCPADQNATQTDTDKDGAGDACDADDDNDTRPDGEDAFPLNPAEWADTDGDTVGDNADNCVAVANADQLNADTDAQGNACDTDDDNDGLADTQDTDSDGDQLPDFDEPKYGAVVGDKDTDDDTRIDGLDAFPANPAEWADTDGDGVGNNADPSDDGDSIADTQDNCPSTPNQSQSNIDGDALGDACDGDKDGDGRSNGQDNCQNAANADQANTDGDDKGDVCDADDDNDGKADADDACPLVSGTGANGCAPATVVTDTTKGTTTGTTGTTGSKTTTGTTGTGVVKVTPTGGTGATQGNAAVQQLVQRIVASITGARRALARDAKADGIAGLLAGTVSARVRNHFPGAWRLEVLQAGTVVARGGKRFTAAQGAATIKLKATTRGKAVLPAAKRLVVTVRVTYTPSGFPPVVKTQRISIAA